MFTAQFLRFRSPPGREVHLLEAHKVAVESCRGAYSAFRADFLVKLEDGDWLDISFWDIAVNGNGQIEHPPLEAKSDFISQLDGLLGDENGLLVNSFTVSSFRGD